MRHAVSSGAGSARRGSWRATHSSSVDVVICAAATDDVKWRETVIWAAVLTAFCAFLFPYGLNLPFQLWPRFW